MKILLPIMMLSLAVSGCAQLSDGLQAVNDTLAGINSGLSGSSGNASSTLSLGTKTTEQYELNNLKMFVRQLGGNYEGALPQTEVTFTGEGRNKTSRLMVVSIHVPIYDKQGRYVSSVMTDVHMPAKERVKINNTVVTVSLTDGNRFNTQKTKYQVNRF
ncbi:MULTISPECIES: hypothetical protein [unclassified Neisseria]|uniref:hypothetical protein n=1 Tax=unclassified Neisseria TaxID=2623750 RepID=UPI002666DCD1|nr:MULTISPECIES: hypothetical protein [unclassified Neisseria]MDO1509543.1 hypothetical protein [Neisseria sp. MVDL19-042950]MDO1515685.1 hypothetical protein [Neisseria sp. MVDL18-041461]MDO1563491.1 hypothetical protein [Neisseria sp. MVDL20-010259]